jgi:SAM-dependent methyltransferase
MHDQTESVREMLAQEGVSAQLHKGDLFEMPFPDGIFDCLMCVSVLEHLRDLDRALAESARVTRPGAIVVLGVPVRNPATDAFFRLAGYNPREVHPSSHSDVQAAAFRNDRLRLQRSASYPHWLPVPMSVYFTLRCLRVEGASRTGC